MTAAPNKPSESIADIKQGRKPGRWLGILFSRWMQNTVHALVTLFAVLFLMASLLILFLSIYGFPNNWVSAWLTELNRNGFSAQVAEVRLDLLRGITAQSVRFFDVADSLHPIAEAEQVTFVLDPVAWMKKKPGLKSLSLRNARVLIESMDVQGRPDPDNSLVLENINSLVDLAPDGLNVRRLTTDLYGVKLRCHGWIRPSGQAGAQPGLRSVIQQFMDAQKDWLPKFLREMKTVQFAVPPKAEIAFDLSSGPTNSMAFYIEGYGTEYRQVAVDGWTLQAELMGRELKITTLSLRKSDRLFDLSGNINLESKTIQAHVFDEIKPWYFLPLMPKAWREKLADKKTDMSGDFRCEVWFGPAVYEEMLEDITGWISLEKTTSLDVWFEKGFFAFKKRGPRMVFDKIDAIVGKGAQQGPLKGAITLDFETRKYEGHVEVGFDPHAVLPLLPKNLAMVTKWFDLKNGQPKGTSDFSGHMEDPREFRMTTHVEVTNFLYRGVEVKSFDAVLNVPAPSTLVMDPTLIVREEGQAQGRLALEFDKELADIDAVCTADPHAVARMIGPTAAKFLRRYRLEGPIHIQGAGLVDYGSNLVTDIRCKVKGEKIGILTFLADRGSFDLYVRGPRIEATNILADIYAGTISGAASFYPVGSTTNYRYETECRFGDLELSQLMQALGRTGVNEKSGKVNGGISLSGFIGNGMGKTAKGEGHFSVHTGRLMEYRLFGGLSRMLSKIYPGLGFATQSELTSEFTIAKGMVTTEEIRVMGGLFSMKGKGSYYFDERLDFDVQFQLLRSGNLAAILRLMTLPVTKLLEFHLSGNLDDPKWRPTNLPKELFFIFD